MQAYYECNYTALSTSQWLLTGPKITKKKTLAIEVPRSSAVGARIEALKAPRGWAVPPPQKFF